MANSGVTRSKQIPNRKILIVQGDWEEGMSLLSLDLKDEGHDVGKVFFCAADFMYKVRGIKTHLFRKPLAEFDAWLRELVRKENYDTFFLYNHYRPYNQVAWALAEELNLGCFVFELGLIRPNCVTVFSSKSQPLPTLAKAWEKILSGGTPPEDMVTPPPLRQASPTVKLFALSANFLFSRLAAPLFPDFVDQQEMKFWSHFKHGVIYLWRFFARSRDSEMNPIFSGELSGKYYAVPLQVHRDTQVTKCSGFSSIEEFIEHVVGSFARHAPADTKLVFKDHPIDRGYKDYSDLIANLDHGLGGGRIFYVDRVHLPTLLSHSRGVVNINSSVGLSGLIHHVPVITLGSAAYNLPELTYQGELSSFWTDAKKPKKKQVKQFINLLLSTNQGRGTLTQRCFNVPGRCKIQWPEPFRKVFFNE
jgi:capsule polysaccharide modification protein KpsS